MFAQVEPDRLGLGVPIEGMETSVPSPESGEFVAAEGRGDVSLAVAVDGHGPRPQLTCGPQGPRAMDAEN